MNGMKWVMPKSKKEMLECWSNTGDTATQKKNGGKCTYLCTVDTQDSVEGKKH